MGWRGVIIESPCKISVGANYLIIRGEEVKKIHLSEIYYLMIASPAVSITGFALCELNRNKIKVVFCDERHDPYAELAPYYGSHNCAKKSDSRRSGVKRSQARSIRSFSQKR